LRKVAEKLARIGKLLYLCERKIKHTLFMKTTGNTKVERLTSPSARVVELVKKLRVRKEEGLAQMRNDLEMA
jgi:hypothetical protein